MLYAGEITDAFAAGCLTTLASKVGLNWVKVIFSSAIRLRIFFGSGFVTTKEQPLTAEVSVKPVPPDVCIGMTRSHFVPGWTPSSADHIYALKVQFRCVSGTPLGFPVVPLV